MNGSAYAYRAQHSTTTTMIEITDILYEATDRRDMSSLMNVDQSVAFDCVTHKTLLDKLKLYNVGEEAINWIQNYLSYRTQYVNIERKKSNKKAVNRLVPQGSNEMTESIQNKNCQNTSHQSTERLFGENCLECGSMVLYADDATYTITSRKSEEKKLVENIQNIITFLNFNDITINMGKTNIT